MAGWSIVEVPGSEPEWAYHLVQTGADGVGRVRFAAKSYADAQAFLGLLEDHELLKGTRFVLPEKKPRARKRATA